MKCFSLSWGSIGNNLFTFQDRGKVCTLPFPDITLGMFVGFLPSFVQTKTWYYFREFVNNVWYIKILSPEDVQKLGKEEVGSLNRGPPERMSSNNSADGRDFMSGLPSIGSLDYWLLSLFDKPSVALLHKSLAFFCFRLINPVSFLRHCSLCSKDLIPICHLYYNAICIS